MPDPICHVELQVNDLPRCKAFYAAAFGWQARPATADYEWLETGGAVTGGIMAGKADRPRGLTVFVAVTDVDAALARVRAAGGQVLEGPRPVPGHGRYALVTDPDGNRLGVWQRPAS
jgi:predicted enzyme related to lactoylglutathione lyase